MQKLDKDYMLETKRLSDLSEERMQRILTQQAQQTAHDHNTLRQETGLNNAIKLCRRMLVKMSNDYSLLMSFFQSCERVFELYNIDEECRVPLAMPLLTDKARLLLTNIPGGGDKKF